MKIAVCIKWVPVVARMKFDTETKRIVREGVPSEVNPYDVLSLQRAVELKESHGAEVTVYTMGPPQARDGLVRCLAQGADRAIHLLDGAFAGSDTLATSRALAAALAKEPYDLILFGYFSVDAETSQVGPEVAELMGLPQVTAASKLDIVDDSTLRIERALDEGTEVVEVTLPAVVTAAEGIAEEVFPSRDAIKEAADAEIPVLTAADIAADASGFGQEGSPTWVSEIRITESTRETQVIEEVPVEQAAEQVVAYLKDHGILDPSRRGARLERTLAPAPVRAPGEGGVWVVAELGSNGVLEVVRELLGAAQPIADAVKGPVTAILMGGPDCGRYAAELAHHGADVVAIAAAEHLSIYSTDACAPTLANAIERHRPYAVLVPSTPNGRDLAARVAARLKLGLTGDCIGLEVDDQGRLVQLKPAFGGNIVAPIFSKTLPNMATVRPGLLDALGPNTGRVAATVTLDVPPVDGSRVRHLETRAASVSDVADLDGAWSIIGIGMGVGGSDSLAELAPLKQLLGAEFGCTRDVVDAGWMPRQLQIGLTGRTVAPDLYVGVGLRGDFNHFVGLQRAGAIVAVNNNRRAAVFRVADVAVLADWREFIPALVDALRPELA
jgi:electron transfer flavoprotein alpha subunit